MVAQGIVAGRRRAGDTMPSSRGFAAHLGSRSITVALAYGNVVSSDHLSVRGRTGHYVLTEAPRALKVPQAPLRGEAGNFTTLTAAKWRRLARLSKPDDWERYPVPFPYGQADASLFDHQNWRHCALCALDKRDFVALTSDCNGIAVDGAT